MIKYICDKCGTEMDETTRFHIEVELPIVRRWDLEFLERGYDLCEECIRKVDAGIQKNTDEEGQIMRFPYALLDDKTCYVVDEKLGRTILGQTEREQ